MQSVLVSEEQKLFSAAEDRRPQFRSHQLSSANVAEFQAGPGYNRYNELKGTALSQWWSLGQLRPLGKCPTLPINQTLVSRGAESAHCTECTPQCMLLYWYGCTSAEHMSHQTLILSMACLLYASKT